VILLFFILIYVISHSILASSIYVCGEELAVQEYCTDISREGLIKPLRYF